MSYLLDNSFFIVFLGMMLLLYGSLARGWSLSNTPILFLLPILIMVSGLGLMLISEKESNNNEKAIRTYYEEQNKVVVEFERLDQTKYQVELNNKEYEIVRVSNKGTINVVVGKD